MRGKAPIRNGGSRTANAMHIESAIDADQGRPAFPERSVSGALQLLPLHGGRMTKEALSRMLVPV
ncbi:hypothetical protein Abiwalacus_22830 [Akkermansia biwaensis]|uniref:Uncharacterized protein n=1 Tax=Akkermansia biwaensis TaxID=2946555 RepID=A0ABM7ZJ37_9BACT|nr:hypothetical protein Abiwalacus_22830 [Akkermansia biwaensis]